MGLSVVFMLVGSSLAFAGDDTSQAMLVDVRVKNSPAKVVIDEIERQTDYLFVYSDDVVDLSYKVSVNAEKSTANEVLDKVFANTSIGYVVHGVNIMLLPKTSLASPSQSVQQQRRVGGTVVDETGRPVAGATVSIRGTASATITGPDGAYSLTVPDGDAVLVFTYIGYSTQEVPAGTQNTIHIAMEPDAQLVDEVVVVGYGTQKKVNLTGSVSTVNFEQIASRPVSSASQILNGASPGLQIMQGHGIPGQEGFGYLVRGVGTMNNSSPLILVDGMESDINTVNPSDIASVTILKDAASSAIYGNRAANGVILVTTKSGVEGKVNVTYNAVFSYSEPFKVVRTISDYVQYMELFNEAAMNVGNSAIFSQSTMDTWTAAKANPNGIAPSGYPNYVAYPNIDWYDHIYSRQWMQKHTISLTGREKKAGYLMSFGYTDNPGIMKKSGYDRLQGRVNLYSDVTDWFRVGTRLSGDVTDTEMSAVSYYGTGNNFFNSINSQKMLPSTYPYYDGMYGAPEGPEDDPQSHNPLWDNVLQGHNKIQRLNTEWYGQVKFLKHFNYNVSFFYTDYRHERKNSGSSIGKFSFSKGAWSTGADDPGTLSTTMYYNRSNRTKLNHVLNYNQDFGNHNVSALVGYEQEEAQSRATSATKRGLTDAAINDLDAAVTPYTTSGSGSEWGSQSLFGRVTYAFKEKYLFEFNIRHDASSRFAPEHRWGTFPSLSAGWRISEESWFSSTRWLSNLKLRASWGKLGNSQIGNYDWQAFYSTTNGGFPNVQNSNYSLGGNTLVSGIAKTTIANNTISWETTTTSNIGIDFGFLDNRLSGTFDFYNKLTAGILFRPDMYMAMGYASGPQENIGNMRNRGIELEMEWRDRVGDFHYTVRGQFSYNQNKVTKYKGDLVRGWNADHSVYSSNIGDVSAGGDTRLLEGHEYYEWFLRSAYKGSGSPFNSDGSVNIKGGPKDGMIRTEDDMNWLKAMQAAGYSFQPYNNIARNGLWYGEYIYADSNEDGIYGNSYDADFTGSSTNPKYNFGLFLAAGWKDIDFSMNWGGAAGFSLYYYRMSNNSSEAVFGYTFPLAVANDHYFYNPENPSDPRTNLTSKQPRLVQITGGGQSGAVTTVHLEKGDFLKLRNVTLGYTLPQHLSRKFYVDKLRVYASGENLFAITGFSGLDPEQRLTVGYSSIRSWAVGIDLTF